MTSAVFLKSPEDNTSAVRFSCTDSPNSILEIQSTSPTITIGGAAINQFESGRIRFTEQRNASAGFQGGYIHYDGSANKLHLGMHETSDTTVSNDVNAITILRANRNVGIGTESPNRQLSIYGTNDGYMSFDGGRTGNHEFVVGSDSAGFIIYDDTLDTYRFVIDQDSGNVGIGTTSPNSKLNINGASAHLNFTGSNNRINFNGYRAIEGSHTGSLLQIGESYSDVSLYGNVGINTTSPNQKLDVNGNINITGGTGRRIYWSNGDMAIHNAGSYAMAFETWTGSALTEKMRINSLGRVDIGTRSYVGSATSTTRLYLEGNTSGHNLGQFQMADFSGGFMFYLSSSSPASRQSHQFYNNRIDSSPTLVGSIQINSSSTAFNTSSDYRLKENVVEMTGALDRVEQLKPSRFNFIGHEEIVDGFLAHEVQDIVPEAITGTKDEVDSEGNPVYQGIDQSKLVPLLVGAIKELKAEIETLKAQINN